MEFSDLMRTPTIRIKDAWLLRENVSKHLHELWGNGEKLVDNEWMQKRVDAYRKAWKPYEERILTGMTGILGLSFRQNIVDVYIAPWFRAFSDPLVIGIMQEPDQFVDTITHGLLHRLITDNTSAPHNIRLVPEWKKLFGGQHSFKTLVHIPVHAVHKAIYLDVLKSPERLERDMASNIEHNAQDYIDAWEYVNEQGHEKIIEKMRNSYVALASK